MSQNTPEQANPFDPFSTWRTMREAYLDTWSKAMIDAVNSEAYAEATGQLLDAYFTASTPVKQVLERTMTTVLTQLNMPTRSDVISLAERLTNIELRLDDLDAKLDAIKHDAESPQAAAQPRQAKQASTSRPADKE